MAKRLAITFPETGTTAIAELMEHEAPKTCAALWKALEQPAMNKVVHAIYAGRELVFALPPANQTFDPLAIPPENQIIAPAPGDLCFRYMRPHELHNPGPEGAHENGLWDFMIFYGRNARLFSAQGWVASNLFGSIIENLHGLAVMGARVHREGMKEVRIERVVER
jgi:hypothetical protein